ncbi:Ankyrin repeat domain containing protein [Balamuthia mandrillaris]
MMEGTREDTAKVLPAELWHHILVELLPKEAWGVLARVCWTWRAIVPESERNRILLSYCCGGEGTSLVKWARERGCPWDRRIGNLLASAGNLEGLSWARCVGAELNEGTCAMAAGAGQLRLLKWLRRHNVPWNKSTWDEAAQNGHLEVLKWIKAKGCPWSKRVYKRSVASGRLDLLQWLRWEDQDLARPRFWSQEAYVEAAAKGHVHVLEWLGGEPREWDRCIKAAVEKGHMDVILYLHSLNCPQLAHRAGWWGARYGRIDVLEWALENDRCSARPSRNAQVAALEWVSMGSQDVPGCAPARPRAHIDLGQDSEATLPLDQWTMHTVRGYKSWTWPSLKDSWDAVFANG